MMDPSGITFFHGGVTDVGHLGVQSLRQTARLRASVMLERDLKGPNCPNNTRVPEIGLTRISW
jgi:hypothetical protein